MSLPVSRRTVPALAAWLALTLSACGGGGGGGSDDGGDGGGGGTPAPVGPAACLDRDTFAVGTQGRMEFDVTQGPDSTSQAVIEFENLPESDFRGYRGVEVRTETTITSGPMTVSNLSYQWRTLRDDDVVEEYGNNVEITGGGRLDNWYQPPFEDLRWTLAEGESFTAERNRYTSFFPTSPVTTTITITFEGREDVTVPAGTFADACKYVIEETYAGDTRILTSWIVRSVSVYETSEESSGDITTLALRQGTLNGEPFVP
jgi:hypothetical protein